jgi:hypothetical protein
MLVGLLCVVTAGGCDSNRETAKTVTVERQVTIEKPPARRKHRRKAPRQPSDTAASQFVNCDPNIQAKVGTTTCPFAQNVFWTFWTSGESSDPLKVWSPAAYTSFSTTCRTSGSQVVCTTSDDAVVTFSQAAVDRYSQAQADTYAGGHDLGPDPYEGLPSPESPSSGDGEAVDDCQGYDPCITPGVDVDCASGSGDGPRYVKGPVNVNGSDPYGLDNNDDGVGCEYG